MFGRRTPVFNSLRMGFKLSAALLALACCLVVPQAARANELPAADTPDPSVLYHAGRYYAYSTGAKLRNCSGATVAMYVPHRSATTLKSWGTTSCFADVMPGGPGAWAKRDYTRVWAPTVYRNPRNTAQFILLYAAVRAGSGQECIGRATASAPSGPFHPDSSALICPGRGLWALDPNVYNDSSYAYIQWRQDPSSTETRLYSARFSADGRTRLTAPRLLLSSNDVSWEAGTIENPAVHLAGTRWQLFFSGNAWNTNNYATGWADCGTSLTSGGKCAVVYSAAKSWFGWSGRGFGGTVRTLPENQLGPGGMSFVTSSTGGFVHDASGNPYVVFHHIVSVPAYFYWARHAAVFKLIYTIYGAFATDF